MSSDNYDDPIMDNNYITDITDIDDENNSIDITDINDISDTSELIDKCEIIVRKLRDYGHFHGINVLSNDNSVSNLVRLFQISQ